MYMEAITELVGDRHGARETTTQRLSCTVSVVIKSIGQGISYPVVQHLVSLDGSVNTPSLGYWSVFELSEDIDLVFTHIQVF